MVMSHNYGTHEFIKDGFFPFLICENFHCDFPHLQKGGQINVRLDGEQAAQKPFNPAKSRTHGHPMPSIIHQKQT